VRKINVALDVGRGVATELIREMPNWSYWALLLLLLRPPWLLKHVTTRSVWC